MDPVEAARRRAARVKAVEGTYGVDQEHLELLEVFQGHRCWGCRRATGEARNLAMDHNHRSGEARMLLCSHCNRYVVGHFRDNPVALIRLGLALIQPPSRAAWTVAGQPEPGWASDDPEFLEWVARRIDKDVH